MAMNKTEKKQFEELEEQLRRVLAFRRTEPVAQDLPYPKFEEGLVKGWMFSVYGGKAKVVPSCSDSTNHGFDNNNRVSAQGPRSQFSCKSRALLAARHELEEQFISALVDLDLEYEQARAAEAAEAVRPKED
jgi:hypothetical protein